MSHLYIFLNGTDRLTPYCRKVQVRLESEASLVNGAVLFTIKQSSSTYHLVFSLCPCQKFDFFPSPC